MQNYFNSVLEHEVKIISFLRHDFELQDVSNCSDMILALSTTQ